MSNIELYQHTQTSLEIADALNSLFVKDMTDFELYEYLRPIIAKSFTDAGYKSPETDQETVYFVKEVLRDVRQICKTFPLRKDEIIICFRKGIRKEYGDFTGLPVIRFYEFLKSYVAHTDRLKALAERNKPLLPEKKEPTEKEKFDTAKLNAVNAFKDFQNDKDISLVGAIVYDFLDGLKLIEFSNQEKKGFFNNAREILIRENQMKAAGKVDQFYLKKIKDTIENLQTGNEEALVKAKAKYLALYNYFQSLALDETDLESLIIWNIG